MTATSASSLLRASNDEDSRHRRAVHVALEVVLARRERRDGEAPGCDAGELPGREELMLRADAVPDREVVVDPGIEVLNGDRGGLSRGDGETVRVPRDVFGADLEVVPARRRA